MCDPLVDIVIPVRPEVCARLGVMPGAAVFRGLSEIEEVVAELGGGRISMGGSVANTCVEFVAGGGRASVLAGWMTDEFSEMIRADMARRGVELPLPHLAEGKAGRCVVLLLPGGERAFLIWQGEPWRMTAISDGVRDWLASETSCDAVLAEGYLLTSEEGTEVVRLALRTAAAIGARRILSLSDRRLVAAQREVFWSIIDAGVDVLIGNDAEFAALSDDGDAERLAAGLGRLGMVALVTMGRRGALTHGPHGRHVVGAADIPAVSALGAGDAFAGGFLCGLLSGLSQEESLARGVACATAAVRVVSARTPLLGQEYSGIPD